MIGIASNVRNFAFTILFVYNEIQLRRITFPKNNRFFNPIHFFFFNYVYLDIIFRHTDFSKNSFHIPVETQILVFLLSQNTFYNFFRLFMIIHSNRSIKVFHNICVGFSTSRQNCSAS